MYRASIKNLNLGKTIYEYTDDEWNDFKEQYGILKYENQMNHWYSWVEIDFKSERHYNIFKLTFSEYI